MAEKSESDFDGEGCEADCLSIWTLFSNPKKKVGRNYRMLIPDTVLFTDSLLATWFYTDEEEGNVSTRLVETTKWMVSLLPKKKNPGFLMISRR